MSEPIPAPIVAAICKIQATLAAVAKSNTNSHGGYKYASADDIYAALAHKMGEVGLVVVTLEESCDIKRLEGKEGKTAQWAHLEFSFLLATADATWTDKRLRRTLYILVTGPQTFQAAQSYAEKAFLRSLFKIPTGDMDLDAMPQSESEEGQVALSATPKKRQSSYAAKKDGKTPELFNEIARHIEGAGDVAALQFVHETYASEWAILPARWDALLSESYETRMVELGGVMETV